MSLDTYVNFPRTESDLIDTTPAPTDPYLTGTGLDLLIDLALNDQGLNRRIDSGEITEAALAMSEMNTIIVEAIKATGIGGDGGIETAEIYELSAHIKATYADAWTLAHGDDEADEETGFHLIQSDGATTRLFGENGINTVADGLYHLGFGIDGRNLINEDGDRNAQVDDVAFWLNALLAKDLAAGTFDAAPEPEIATTGTGLDALVAMIETDQGLGKRLPLSEIRDGAEAANAMNEAIVEGIKALGLVNDGGLSAADVTALSDWIMANRAASFTAAHGDDEDGTETGFHLVQNDGANTRLFGENGVNTVADGIYHLVFGYERGRLINEDGNRNASLEDVADWMNRLLVDDMEALANDEADAYPAGETGTGLDQLVKFIAEDPGLTRKVTAEDITEAAEAANTMNAIIVDGIEALDLGADGTLSPAEVFALSDWIRTNHSEAFIAAHGDDENNEETGFHRVQNDGAEARMWGDNIVNTIADGIYHLVFGYDGDRLVNEDGDRNARVEQVAYWLNELLSEDLEDWADDPETTPAPSGLDQLVALIADDPELNRRLPLDEIVDAMAAAQGMNEIIVEAIKATGVAFNGNLTAGDVMEISDWINDNRYDAWVEFHGDDENDEETGFHLVQNDGAITRLYAENGVNTVADGIYHLGFGYDRGRLINEDGDRNATLDDVAYWLSDLLADELDDGSLEGEANPYDVAGTDTGLDQLTNAIFEDPRLSRSFSTRDLAQAARAADALNDMLLEAIEATGAANDGTISAYDIGLIDAWISENVLEAWDVLAGADARDGDGFRKLIGEGASIRLDDADAIDGIGRALYALGHGLKYGKGVIDADGRWVGTAADVAGHLNALLATELTDGSLVNEALLPADPASFADALVAEISGPITVGDGAGATQIAHDGAQEIDSGAVAISFTADDVDGWQKRVLLSKDHSGYEDGGHTTIWVAHGRVYVRLQDDDQSWVLSSPKGSVEAGAPVDLVLNFGPDGAELWLDGEMVAANDEAVVSWSLNDNPVAIGESRMYARDDGLTGRDLFDGEITAVQIYNRPLDITEVLGLDRPEPAAEPNVSDPAPEVAGAERSGTGLDELLRWIETDSGLVERTSAEDRAEAADSAAGMNAIILEAIAATGAADDGAFTTGEVYDIADWINANRYEDWLAFHGDDENGVETGFHRVQNDGGEMRAFGDAAINTVADGIYHLGFGTERDRLLNEDGNRNARVEQVAMWLNALLADELDAGSLETDAGVAPVATTGTGLDGLIEIAAADPELLRRVPESELIAATEAMNVMNGHILDGIEALGLANDGLVTAAETAGLSDYIVLHFAESFTQAHGDDEDGEETGFHLIQNDGAVTRLFAENAINTVADGIYHLVFGYECGRLINEDGNRNASLEDVGAWLTQLFSDDMESLANENVSPVAPGDTGTGLDGLVTAIAEDAGLNKRVSLGEIQDGADAANAMNHMIVDSIKALGLANDGVLLESEIRGLAEYITATYGGEDGAWTIAHGDDEAGEETGFHLVQNDGATGRLYNENAVNTVADGIYHLGFGHNGWRLINEDGNANQTIADVADWLNDLLADDMEALANSEVAAFAGTTGTGLDAWIGMMMSDTGLNQRLSVTEITEGAMAADAINRMIVEGVTATGIARDGQFNAADMRLLSDWVAETYNEDGMGAFWVAHGDDEGDTETGFHLIQNDGATTQLFGENAVNTVFDGTYHLGFGYRSDRLINEDGNNNQKLSDVAYWLEAALAEEIADGSLVTTDSADPYIAGTTGTGLDGLVEIITGDDELGRRLSTPEIAEAAEAADGLNTLLLDAIAATDVTADGKLTATDLKDVSLYLQANAADDWATLHGDDSGFDLAWRAGSSLFDRSAVRDVADAIYNLGFGFRGNNVRTETGGWDEKLSTVADWMSDLLGDAVTDGSLANAPLTAETFGADPVVEIADLTVDSGSDAFVFAAEGAAAAGSFTANITADAASSGRQVIVSRGTKYDDDGAIRLELDNGRLELELRQDGRYLRLDSGDLAFEDGENYAVGFSYDAETISLYVNGAKVDLEQNPGFDFAAMDTSMLLGAVHYERWDGRLDPIYVFDGEIADATVYDDVLDNAEMAYLGLPSTDGSQSPDLAPLLAVTADDALLVA